MLDGSNKIYGNKKCEGRGIRNVVILMYENSAGKRNNGGM
jgi:hypothetical protein